MTIRIVALITARGGSKRVPGKNIRPVGGKPLILWTVEAALAARSLARVIVSTDAPEIADICRAGGAEIPFMRPAELAGDRSSHTGVILHALDWLRQDEGQLPDYLLLLQPTTPLRTAADIDAAAELAVSRDADMVVSVCPAPAHPLLTFRMENNGRLQGFLPRLAEYTRSQDMPPAYVINGALYLAKPEGLYRRPDIVPENPLAYVMPEERSLDIDTEWHLRLADLLLGNGMTETSRAGSAPE